MPSRPPECTPLLRQGHATPALETFFSWLSEDSLGAPLLRLKLVSGDGAFTKALTDNQPVRFYLRLERRF